MTLYNEPTAAPEQQSDRNFFIVALVAMGVLVFVMALIMFYRTKEEAAVTPQPANAALIGADWAATQATGEPNADKQGSPAVWRPVFEDGGVEWLRLVYARPFTVKRIVIYETNARESITTVTKESDSRELSLWERETNQGNPLSFAERTTTITLNRPEELQVLVVYLDTAAKGWNEIDAVGVEDEQGVIHWAVAAEASSSYADTFVSEEFTEDPLYTVFPTHGRAWGPEQATGVVDSPIPLGDYRTAWASLTEDAQDEWLRLSYGSPIQTAQIYVYESFNPGALWKITKLDGDEETVIWEGDDPVYNYPLDGYVARIVLEEPQLLKEIKLYIRSTDVPGWNEIDAVGLLDTSEQFHWAIDAESSTTFADQMAGMY